MLYSIVFPAIDSHETPAIKINMPSLAIKTKNTFEQKSGKKENEIIIKIREIKLNENHNCNKF